MPATSESPSYSQRLDPLPNEGLGPSDCSSVEELLRSAFSCERGSCNGHMVADMMTSLINESSNMLPYVSVPDYESFDVESTEDPVVRHNTSFGNYRSLEQFWLEEGESPKWEAPLFLTELQVWHRGKLFTFHGLNAAHRLQFIPPTVCRTKIGDRNGSVARAVVRDKIALRVSGATLARCYTGATGIISNDPKELADTILSPGWRNTREIQGVHKNKRFWDGIARVFATFGLMSNRYCDRLYLVLAQILVGSMLSEGRSEATCVKVFLDHLQCVLHGPGPDDDALHQFINTLDDEEKAMLWKTRRLFPKDDNDMKANSEAALQRMCATSEFTSQQLVTAEQALKEYERKASAFVAANLEELKKRHDQASMHRSAASLFFSRSAGGGAAELHLTVALYRLSQGKVSTLQDVWGSIPENIDVNTLSSLIHLHDESRKEALLACEWMIGEVKRRGISFPFLSIFPEREPKSRNFLMLPYCLQQGGYQASTTVGLYLGRRSDTTEVFNGFQTRSWLEAVRSDVSAGATHALSLDSAVSTDPLPHDYCLRVYKPFYPVFSSYTIAALEEIFSPMRVHVAKKRPAAVLPRLAFSVALGQGLNLEIVPAVVKVTKQIREPTPLRVHLHNVPEFLRTAPQAREVAVAIKEHQRVLLVAPTGSGKTVLAATMMNAIIQFPSIAALEIFSKTLSDMQKPHNVWYSLKKEDFNVWDHACGEPRTILCTSFYVSILSEQYPGMVCVLDEAETKQEHYLLNLEWTKRKGRKTLLMTATPDELLGEEDTHRITLQGGTNFPVEERECTMEEMMQMCLDESLGQKLICCHSEPLCEKLAFRLSKAEISTLALTGRVRQTDYIPLLDTVSVIISTNVIRSSVTLPGVVIAFDLLRLYETVDFPLAGFESLVLMKVSRSMALQCKGRVGRLQPGVYFRVTDPPGDAISYEPKFLARAPIISQRLGQISLHAYSREISAASCIVEKYGQRLAERAGVHNSRDRPLWASTIRDIAVGNRQKLLALVGFEACGIASRTRQLARDLDMSEVYDNYRQNAARDYFGAVESLLNALAQYKWFTNEILQIRRWRDGLENTSDHFYCETNQYALCVALWRQVSVCEEQGLLRGVFRPFHVRIPDGFQAEKNKHYLVLGLSLHQNAVTARAILSLSEVAVQKAQQLHAKTVSISCDEDLIGSDIPITGWDVSLQNDGRQGRKMELRFDGISRSHLFQPEDAENIWSTMINALNEAKDGEDHITTRGSPMSSTASFAVLNSLGLAAHDLVRKETGEPLRGASIFGDDDFVAGSEEACRRVSDVREALGLQTKWSHTGLSDFAENGELRKCVGQLGLFTERLIDLNTLQQIPAPKPAGMVRLYQSYHPNELWLQTQAFAADMDGYFQTLQSQAPEWSDLLTAGSGEVDRRVARRETAPRRILQKALRSELAPGHRVAKGDVSRLFDHLELLLLMYYPSTKGAPDRVIPQEERAMQPLIRYEDAVQLAEKLQGNDCYFKLHGPPLRFETGRYVVEEAVDIFARKGGDVETLTHLSDAYDHIGWFNRPYDRTSDPIVAYPLEEELDPMEYGDAVE